MKKTKKKEARYSFRTTPEFLKRVHQAASAEKRSANSWIFVTLEEKLNGK